MQIDFYWLQKRHGLALGCALGPHGCLANGRRGQGGDGLHVTKHQRACRQRCHGEIERNLGLSACKKIGGGALRYVEETVNLAPLNGFARTFHALEVHDYPTRLKGVESSCHAARSGRTIEVNHTYGHVFRLAFSHQRSEENGYDDREKHKAHQIHGVVANQSALTTHGSPQRFWKRDGLFCHGFLMTSDIPGRSPSNLPTGRAFTSNVFRSYCPVAFVAFQTA